MAHLFWNDPKGKKNLVSKEFLSEREFENYILKNQDLLGEDIFLIDQQIRGGSKSGIPDIIGFDQENNVCIVEMKDEKVTYEIANQILKYAFWAKNNPSEIQNIFLKSKAADYDIEIDCDGSDFGVRMIVVAPQIDQSVSMIYETFSASAFDVEFFDIKRWADGKNEFVLVDKYEPNVSKKPKIPKGRINYGEDEYVAERNSEAAKRFWKLTNEIEEICKEKNWLLKKNPRKHYCHMQYGIYNVFGMKWLGSKSFCIEINNVPEKDLKKYQPKKAELHHRTKKRHARYVIDEHTSIRDFIPLFKKALDIIKNKRG